MFLPRLVRIVVTHRCTILCRRKNSLNQYIFRTMSNMERKIIVDSDAGIDDAVSILLALKECNNVIALTSVFGNTSSEQAAVNLCRIVGIHCASEEMKTCCTTKVYQGAVHPIMELSRPKSWEGHGPNGLGGSNCEEFAKRFLPSVEEDHAVNAMIRLVKTCRGEIDLIALGPLTNLALAFNLYPDFFKDLKSLYIMGGADSAKGNWSAVAEYNFASDPESAKIVISAASASGIPVVVVPWEPCERSGISWSHFDKLTTLGTKRSQFLKSISFSQETLFRSKARKFILADVFAMMALLFPEYVKDKVQVHMNIETSGDYCRAMCVIDWYGLNFPDKPKVILCREFMTSFVWDVVETLLKS